MALDGTYTYTFTLSENLDATSTTNIEKAYKKGDSASIGDSVDFRGIPYYMSQLNEFIRTFSANVNQLQNAGYDMNNDHGVDLFVGLDSKTNKQMDMIELIRNTKDGYYYLNGSKVFSFSGNIDDSTDPTKITAGADKNDATLIDYLKNNEYTIKRDSEEVVSKNGIKGKIYTLVNKDGDDTETILYRMIQKHILIQLVFNRGCKRRCSFIILWNYGGTLSGKQECCKRRKTYGSS